MDLPDVQNERGDYVCSVEAGIKGLKLPLRIKNRNEQMVDTVATIELLSRLPKHLRGINMSRLPTLLTSIDNTKWAHDLMKDILKETLKVTESDFTEAKMSFPYFYCSEAPVSGLCGLSNADVEIRGMEHSWGEQEIAIAVTTYVTLLCPCSKEISQYGAHNQRAAIKITVLPRPNEFVWFEDLIEIANASASSKTYPILKRPDEKYVTERAYEHPKFVEDAARHAAESLRAQDRWAFFTVEVTSQESIHQHNAYARVYWDRGSSW